MTRQSTESTLGEQANDHRDETTAATRRAFLTAAGSTGAVVVGSGVTAGTGLVGTAGADRIGPTPWLEREGNRLNDPEGRTVMLCGTSITDPGSMHANRSLPEPVDAVDALTNTEQHWYNRLVRVPVRPEFVAARGDGPIPHGDEIGPLLPGQFDAADLEYYLATFVDPVVDRCEERGVYVLLSYFRDQVVFHQEEYKYHDVESWSCASDGGDDWRQPDICGERGVLWHGEDQIDEIRQLLEEQELLETYNLDEDDIYFEPPAITTALDDELHRFWASVADRYGERSHVLFELFSSPTGPYSDDWGAPDRLVGCTGWCEMPDIRDSTSKGYWDLWVDRAQPWVDTIREHAPRNVVAIGSPSWCQYTYWAPYNEFEGENLVYTGQTYTQDNVRPLSEYSGDPAEDVPVFMTEFGWYDFETRVSTPWADGTTTEYAPEFESLFESFPIHPIAAPFDYLVDPLVYDRDRNPDGEVLVHDPEEQHGHWWRAFLERTYDGPAGAHNPPIVNFADGAPRDPDGDGLYENLDGSGETTTTDVNVFFEHLEDSAVADYPEYYHFDGNDRVTISDIVSLFEQI